jgi:hypothetical protein
MHEDHDLPDGPLFGPPLGDSTLADGSDAVDLSEPLRLLLDDVEDLGTECGDQPVGEAGSDPLDETGAEEPFHPLGRGGRRRLEVRRLELEPVGRVVHPGTGSLDRFTCPDARRLADDGHEFPPSPDGDPQDGETALLAVERHSLDRPAEKLSRIRV